MLFFMRDGCLVSLRRYAGLILAFAVAVVPATLVRASLTNSEPAPAQVSLAGQLLIATPAMGDPRFSQTVILMVRHDRNGALGIVINRPLRERPIAQILEAFGENSAGIEGSVRIFAGGPVQPGLGFVIHSPEYRRAETLDIDGRMAVTTTTEVLRDIANNKGPEKKLIALGYAGWAPGQLEGELKQEAWFTAPADPKIVFDDDREKVWDNAMAKRPRDI